MTAVDAFKIKVAQDACAQGAIISLHSAVPVDANEISGGGYARRTTTWSAPTVPTAGADAGKAVAVGSTQQFTVPASTTVSHFGVRKADGTLLWGDALAPGITLNANGPGNIDVTPTYKYSHA